MRRATRVTLFWRLAPPRRWRRRWRRTRCCRVATRRPRQSRCSSWPIPLFTNARTLYACHLSSRNQSTSQPVNTAHKASTNNVEQDDLVLQAQGNGARARDAPLEDDEAQRSWLHCPNRSLCQGACWLIRDTRGAWQGQTARPARAR